jgi:hypothetical protein
MTVCRLSLISLLFFAATFAASPAHAASPRARVVCQSNMVYDGHGKTLDGRGRNVVFALWNCRNVVIRNWVIKGDSGTRVFDLSGSSNITIENVTFQGRLGDGANIRSCVSITLRNVTADTMDRYFVWCDNTNGLSMFSCRLLTGSRLETGIRLQYNVHNVRLQSCNIRNVLNKNTALRLHDGNGFRVSNCTFEGQVQVGPMGEDQGGQTESNAVVRRQELARRTTNVLFENVTIKGALCPLAGLSRFNMNGGWVIAKEGRLFYNWPVTKVSWSYPDKQHVRKGDVLRPTPSGTLNGVRFTAHGRRTINMDTNGPLTPVDCSLNGRRVG